MAHIGPFDAAPILAAQARAVAEQALDKVRGAPRGERNNTLNAQTFFLGTIVRAGHISESWATDALLSAALSAGLDRAEALTTIRTSLRTGTTAWTGTLDQRSYREPTPEDREKLVAASRLYAEAEPIEGGRGADYLARRGLTTIPSGWRYSSAFNGLVVPIVLANGAVTAIQKIPINPDLTRGRKLTNGMMLDGVVILRGTGPVVVVVDGPEDALAVHQDTGWTAIATCGKGRLHYAAAHVRAGDRVLVVRDRDESAGPAYDRATAAIEAAKATATVVDPPEPAKDANDVLLAGGPGAVKAWLAPQQSPAAWLEQFAAETYSGDPAPIRWLVKGSIPLGVPAILAAMGDTGKSFLMLDLAFRVACGGPVPALHDADHIFGGPVVARGSVVIITAEDTRASVHRRLASIDPEGRRFNAPHKLYIVPLPDAGGPKALVERTNKGLVPSAKWGELLDTMRAVPGLALVVLDPLQAFVQADLNDMATSQLAASLLGRMASETGATVIATHHMSKSDKVDGPEAARKAVRGSSAIVDGVRCVYALWPAPPDEARRKCRTLGIKSAPGKVVCGAVVKANEQATREVQTYVRDDTGLLRDRTAELQSQQSTDDLVALLAAECAKAAEGGMPYTRNGASGLYAQRSDLPSPLDMASKNKLETLSQLALDRGLLIQCKGTGRGAPGYLDTPSGRLAQGLPIEPVAGARKVLLADVQSD